MSRQVPLRCDGAALLAARCEVALQNSRRSLHSDSCSESDYEAHAARAQNPQLAQPAASEIASARAAAGASAIDRGVRCDDSRRLGNGSSRQAAARVGAGAERCSLPGWVLARADVRTPGRTTNGRSGPLAAPRS